jgi:hypothetical protein
MRMIPMRRTPRKNKRRTGILRKMHMDMDMRVRS